MKWLLQSSVDPTKVSLTVRGVLIGFVPAIVLIANLKGWQLGEDGVLLAIDTFVAFLSGVLTAFAAVQTLYGFARKVYLTFKKQ